MSRDTTLNTTNETFDWVKDIWSSHCSPKMKVFTWSIIQRALPLGENLQSRGIQTQAMCIRCKEKETAKHIFFECPFAKEVWKRIPWWIKWRPKIRSEIWSLIRSVGFLRSQRSDTTDHHRGQSKPRRIFQTERPPLSSS